MRIHSYREATEDRSRYKAALAGLDPKKVAKLGLERTLRCYTIDGKPAWMIDASASNPLALGPKEVVTALELCAALPVGLLSLYRRDKLKPDAVDLIAASRAAKHLWALELSSSPRAATGLGAAIAAGAFPVLREIHATGCELAAPFIVALAGSEHAANLEVLDVGGASTSDEALLALADSRHLRRLRILRLVGQEIARAGVEAIANSAILASVQRLAIRGTQAGSLLPPECASALARSPHVAACEELDLGIGLDDAAAEAVAASPHLAKVRTLTLWGEAVTVIGARALGGGSLRPRTLHLQGYGWGDGPGCAALVGGALMSNVEELSASFLLPEAGAALGSHPTARPKRLRFRQLNRFGEEGVSGLIGPAMVALEELQLDGGRHGDAVAIAIAKSPHLARLRTLDLSNNEIGDPGALAVAEAAHLGALEELQIGDRLSPKGAAALIESKHLGSLRKLVLSRCQATPALNKLAAARQLDVRYGG